ncbi:hypothetical protein [Thiorhodococcus minor]|uniref:Uncharacterized protein n=1 Tax=Thiorhodococcus minor TaxID=57489 RepID=A0A6M0K9E1_9GAMM|nr:hypothetical protein [Thiorhodococcus minor]NEV65337.1 hypothetical protein [Thiorhodococcus minor]
MKHQVHIAAATLAALTILAFLLSTIVSELFLSYKAVAAVKQAIAYALLGLIPLLIITAGSGFSLAGKRQHLLVTAKQRRMPFVAMNGLLILAPLALYLNAKAGSAEFDAWFYAAQCLELLAGAANLSLIALNFRDGLRLSRRRSLASAEGA